MLHLHRNASISTTRISASLSCSALFRSFSATLSALIGPVVFHISAFAPQHGLRSIRLLCHVWDACSGGWLSNCVNPSISKFTSIPKHGPVKCTC